MRQAPTQRHHDQTPAHGLRRTRIFLCHAQCSCVRGFVGAIAKRPYRRQCWRCLPYQTLNGLVVIGADQAAEDLIEAVQVPSYMQCAVLLCYHVACNSDAKAGDAMEGPRQGVSGTPDL